MDSLTQDGLTYCGLMQGSANGAWWPQEAEQNNYAGLTDLAERHGARELEIRKLSLARTIEAEIIPRLMLLHREVPTLLKAPARSIDGGQEVERFCHTVMDCPLEEAAQLVAALRSEGLALDTIYMDLFAPTARRLGEMWEADTCGFAEVTIGLSRIQQLMQNLSATFCEERVTHGQAPRALLIPSPGEQHTMGLYMVSEFFRREGWDVWGNSFDANTDLAKLVAAEWFDVVGFSLASEVKLERLKPCIDAVRAASLNPSVKILVGGPIVVARPDVVEHVGADAMALDAQQAVQVATDLVALQKWR